jgi:hypothetical protein
MPDVVCPNSVAYGYNKIRALGGCQPKEHSAVAPFKEFKVTYHWVEIEDGIVCKFSLESSDHRFTLQASDASVGPSCGSRISCLGHFMQVLNTNEAHPQEGLPLGEGLSKYELKECENHVDMMDRHPWQGLMGLKQLDPRELEERRLSAPKQMLTLQQLASIPASFDARTKWPQCSWLNSPKNQGGCGRCLTASLASVPRSAQAQWCLAEHCSCWAFAAALTVSIRLCAATNGTYNVDISPQAMTSCTITAGCQGGYPDCAFWYGHVWLPCVACMARTSKACDAAGLAALQASEQQRQPVLVVPRPDGAQLANGFGDLSSVQGPRPQHRRHLPVSLRCAAGPDLHG